MSKLRKAILIIGILVIAVAASLGTALALYATGTIKTDPIELEFKLKEPQEAKVYDGTPLKLWRVDFDDPYNSDIELSKGKLQSGHTAKVEFVGSQTNVGTSMSDANIKIYDENGFNVTNEYSIKVIGAQLTVVQKKISVELPAQKVVYNGSKVLFNEYKIAENSEGGLCNGHRIYGSTNAELLNVGDTLPEDLTPLIFDVVGNDVTANYKIEEFKYDGIEVVKRPVTVRPVSYEKVYDGIELVADEIEFVDGTSLVEGQTVEFEINEGYTNKLNGVGETKTTITSLTIFETVGEEKLDVTENYEFNLKEYTGLLKVTPRPLTVTAMSASFVYNGEEQSLEDETRAAAVEGLVEGEELYRVTYVGSRTDVGVSTNMISEVELTCSPDNYDVTVIDGTIEITRYEATFKTYSAEKFYDGNKLSEEHSDFTFVKEGHRIVIAEGSALPEITNVGEISNAYKVKIVDTKNGNADCTENYAISYDYGTLTVKRLPVSVTLKNGDDREKVNYDSKTHTPTLGEGDENSEYFAVEPILKVGETVAEFTLDYRDFDTVAETRTMRDAGTYYYSVKFKDEQVEQRRLYSNYELFVAESGVLEITPLPVDVSLKKYTEGAAFTYSGKAVKLDIAEAIESIAPSDSATLPDDVQFDKLLKKEDFTVVKREIKGEGDKAYTVLVNEIIDASENYLYTVKISDSSVAKNFDVTITGLEENAEGVNLTVKAMPVTVTLADVEHVYNGEEQTVDMSETLVKIERTTPLSDDDDDNETGLTAGSLAVVFDGNGNRKDAKDYTFRVEIPDAKKKLKNNYELKVVNKLNAENNNATLKVKRFELEVVTDTCEFEYKGVNQSSGEFTYGALANSSHEVKRATTSTLKTVKNVGDTNLNVFEVTVSDGTDNVTDNYDIKYVNGTLTVRKRPITITTGEESRPYNGSALTKNTATADSGLLSLHKILTPTSESEIPSQTNFGKTVNELDCNIVEKSTNLSVTSNYEITYIYGTLEVTKRDAVLRTYGYERSYNGEPLYNERVTFEGDDELELNFTAQPKKRFSIINAGKVKNVFECVIMLGGDDVTDNFTIEFSDKCEYLTVNPVAATFTLNDFTISDNVDMTYDGKRKKFDVKEAITSIKIGKDIYYVNDDRAEGSGIAFAKGDFEIEYSSAIIDAGTYQYAVKFTDEAFGNNFVIADEDQLTCNVRVKQMKLQLELKSFTGDDALVFDNAVQVLDADDDEIIRILDGDELLTVADFTDNLISDSDFVIVYPEQLINAGDYKYMVKIEDEKFAKNFLLIDYEGDVTIKQFNLVVSLKDCTATYSGKEFVITEDAFDIAEDYFTDGTPISDYISFADFTFETTDGSSMLDANTYKYVAKLADEIKARNYFIDVDERPGYGANVEITKAAATVVAKDVVKSFNNKDQSIEKAEALRIIETPPTILDDGTEIEMPQVTFDDFDIKLYRDGVEIFTLFEFGDYSFEAELTNPNFYLTGNVSGVIDGTIEVKKYQATVVFKNLDKVYDGEGYVVKPYAVISTVEGDGNLFRIGDFEVEYDDALTDHSDAREYTLKVKLIEDYDEIADNVDVVTENNVFKISKKNLTITTQSDTFEYDGGEHSAYDAPTLSGAVKGHYAVVKEDSIKKVVDVANEPYANETKYSVYVAITDDGATERDVSENYDITYINGKLNVTPRAVKVTTGSADKEYDGEKLTCDEIESVEGLLEGHDCKVLGELPSRTEVGKTDNKHGVKIVTKEDVDVTANYAVSYTYGKLEVTATAIKVEFKTDVEFVYSGSEISIGNADTVIGSITTVNASSTGAQPRTEDFVVILNGEVVNAGTYSFTVKIKSDCHPERYEIAPAVGSITVNKLELNVTLKDYTGTLSMEYTGKAQKVNETAATVAENPDGITGVDLTFNYYDENNEEVQMLNVGTYTYKAKIADETLNGNYKIKDTAGTYKIVPTEITVTLKNYTETYSNTNFTIDVYDAIEEIEGTLKAKLGKSDFAPKYVDTLRYAGDYNYEVEIADVEKSKNYNLAINGGGFTINRRKLIVEFTDLELSEREFAEGYGSNEYAVDFDVTKCVSISASTPVASGDVFRVISATAEGLGDNYLGLYTLGEGDYELTNEDSYEFVNLSSTVPLTAKLKITAD